MNYSVWAESLDRYFLIHLMLWRWKYAILQVLLICSFRFRLLFKPLVPRFFAPVTGLTLVSPIVRWSILTFSNCRLLPTIISSVLPSLILSLSMIIHDGISLIQRSIAKKTKQVSWINLKKFITKRDGIKTNCGSLVHYKVRWTVITNCDSLLIY